MDHRSGYMTWLLSAPSFLIVIAFSGLTYIKREKYMLHELGHILKNDMILGGYTKEEIQDIIKRNTYQGTTATLWFTKWRKINAQ